MTVGVRLRADRDDLAHAGDLRRDRRHQERRGQRVASARHVTADALERRRRAARSSRRPPGCVVQPRGTCRRATCLMFRAAAAIARRTSDATDAAPRSHLRARDLDVARQAVEPLRVRQHARDRRAAARRSRCARRAARTPGRAPGRDPAAPPPPAHRCSRRSVSLVTSASRFPDSQISDISRSHMTILFSGYSTMPWALAPFRRGIDRGPCAPR